MDNLSFGYSPCPNDTYMFASIASGKVDLDGNKIIPVLHDIETLNSMALNEALDISKLSLYAYFKVKKKYQLLLNGGAMGFDCGPVLIGKRNLDKQQIRESRIVFPGKLTTAHLLFRIWEPDANKRIFTTYDKIFDFLNTGKADCGVVIHESRFTFEKLGFHLLIDLGSWWKKITGMPVPLGCIVGRKEIRSESLRKIDTMLKSSLERANSNPEEVLPYVRRFAQEFSDEVLLNHVYTFVNEFSYGFGKLGLKAINKLHLMASELGIVEK